MQDKFVYIFTRYACELLCFLSNNLSLIINSLYSYETMTSEYVKNN